MHLNAKMSPVKMEAAPREEQVTGGKLTVLVAEDEANLRIPLVKVLEFKVGDFDKVIDMSSRHGIDSVEHGFKCGQVLAHMVSLCG